MDFEIDVIDAYEGGQTSEDTWPHFGGYKPGKDIVFSNIITISFYWSFEI